MTTSFPAGAKERAARGRSRDRDADPGPAPARAALHEAALSYLARGSATAATLTRALDRKVANWARRAERARRDPELVAADVATCRESIAAIVARFREVGLIDDAAYAASRARSLSRAGRSRRAISAHLAAKGVAAETVREALPTDANVELAAALAFARKRRIGPYAREAADDDRAARQKALAAMARAGFAFGTCERALGMELEEADERLAADPLGAAWSR
ncbi:MAG: RecX family transcriptional regulator [Labilithrix sp.]|nr:RecX family transcriptional regulator [Labilithrix sp.]